MFLMTGEMQTLHPKGTCGGHFIITIDNMGKITWSAAAKG